MCVFKNEFVLAFVRGVDITDNAVLLSEGNAPVARPGEQTFMLIPRTLRTSGK